MVVLGCKITTLKPGETGEDLLRLWFSAFTYR